jgi:hypothetical protein
MDQNDSNGFICIILSGFQVIPLNSLGKLVLILLVLIYTSVENLPCIPPSLSIHVSLVFIFTTGL